MIKFYKDYSEEDPRDYDFCLVWCEYDACKEFNIAYLDDSDDWRSEETDEILPVTQWSPADDLMKVLR